MNAKETLRNDYCDNDDIMEDIEVESDDDRLSCIERMQI